MPTVEELQEQLREERQRRDELEQQLTEASIDKEEFDEIQQKALSAEETVNAMREKLDAAEVTNKRNAFNQRKKEILGNLGLAADDPAVQLAFPNDEILDDATLNSRQESLKAIAARRAPVPPPTSGADRPPGWEGYKGPGVTESGAGDDGLTIERRRWEGNKKKYTETRNVRDLVNGGIRGVLKRIRTRKTPGGTSYVEIEEV